MRKIKVYDQLSIYAQRMLDLMHDPAWCGLEDDIYENEDGWVLYNGELARYNSGEEFTRYNNIEELDYKLSRMLIDFVAEQIRLLDDPEEISDIAKDLVI